jgi:hypothetical protein
MPALEKERPITRRHPAVGVPGGVADDIRLGLDDAANSDACSHLPLQYLVDEITSERDRIDRQLRTSERWMATLMSARVQRICSTH